MNRELPEFQAGFRKGRRTRVQIANIRWIIKKAREFQRNIYLCFIDYTKAFGCMDHNKLWKILKEMGIWDHLTCIMRNMSPCLFNLYAQCIMEMLGWIKHKLESRLPGEISITSDMQICRWYHSYGRNQRRTKGPLHASEKREWKWKKLT